MPMRKIIIVSNRLPITLTRDEYQYYWQKSSGGLVSGLEGLKDLVDFIWVGWPGLDIQESSQEAIERELTKHTNCVPVFLKKALAISFYTKYCNETLWPLLHNFISLYRYRVKYKKACVTANRKFAEKVLALAEDCDFVWVHDYHMLFLPGMLNEKSKRKFKIGFFLHTNFPAPDVFTLIPDWKELCQSLLTCDLIGFHSWSYCTNFMKVYEGIEKTERIEEGIVYRGHLAKVQAFPLGICPSKFVKALEIDDVKTYQKTLEEKYKGKKILLGVDRLDYIKGIEYKLKALELFLESCSEDVVLIQVAVPTREDVLAYRSYAKYISNLCRKVNKRQKKQVVELIHSSVSFHDLVALYRVADVCVISSLVDGLNLVAYEYITCQKEKSGVLLLSKFTGSAEVLQTPMLIDPTDIHSFANKMAQALNMEEGIRRDMQMNLFNTVMSKTSHVWAKHFLAEIGVMSDEGN